MMLPVLPEHLTQREGDVIRTYQLNKPQVACEELAGDLLLLHFGSGLYFNLRGTGAETPRPQGAGRSSTKIDFPITEVHWRSAF